MWNTGGQRSCWAAAFGIRGRNGGSMAVAVWWWDMMGTSSRGPINGMWERTCGRTLPGVLLPVPTTGCWIGGTGAAGAVAGLSQPYLPPALLGVQDEEALLSCGSDLRYTMADTGFLSSLVLTGIRHCQLLSPACWELLLAGRAGARLEGPGHGDLDYLLIVAHPTLPGLDAKGDSVLALSCGWRSCPSSGNRFFAFLALWFGV